MAGEWRVAVVGATGLVGEAIVAALAARQFPLKSLTLLGSDRSIGRGVTFGERQLPVDDVASFDFAEADLALFAAGEEVAASLVPRAMEAGCRVIDTSPHFRGDMAVPLIVPDVNPHALAPGSGIVAIPAPVVTLLATVLAPLAGVATVERVDVTVLQAVSEAGRAGIEELASQTAQLLNGRPVTRSRVFPRQVAFNCVPQVGSIDADGWTEAERAIGSELVRVLDAPALAVDATIVTVPVFYGDSLVVRLATAAPVSVGSVRAALQSSPGIILGEPRRVSGYATPAGEAVDQDAVFVGRIRHHGQQGHGLTFWVVGDNVRRAVAYSTVRVAQILVNGRW
jgi:aspartate-semialdehyde dehydrogenase